MTLPPLSKEFVDGMEAGVRIVKGLSMTTPEARGPQFERLIAKALAWVEFDRTRAPDGAL